MTYLIALLLPPLALLIVGKPIQAVLCVVLMLTVIGWPVASVWAILVVHNSHADRRAQRIIHEMHRQQRQ